MDVAVAALVSAAEEGGSFLVSPSLGLVLWTLLVFVAVALAVFFVGRWLLALRRDRAGRS